MVAKQKRPAPAEEPPQPAKKHKIDFGDEIAVGFAGHVFHVPSVLLRSRSAFATRETRDGVLQIANKSRLAMDTFSTYLQLLHTGKVVLEEPQEALRPDEKCMKLINLYCLSEELQDPTSMNLIIAQLANTFGGFLFYNSAKDIVQRAYGGTKAGSMLREFVLDCAVSRWYYQDYKMVPEWFKDDLLMRFQEMRDIPGRAEAIRLKTGLPERYFVPA